ncbi:uncharacterized protein LOC144359031 [Saccoglossus kowalevskii]
MLLMSESRTYGRIVATMVLSIISSTFAAGLLIYTAIADEQIVSGSKTRLNIIKDFIIVLTAIECIIAMVILRFTCHSYCTHDEQVTPDMSEEEKTMLAYK